MKLNCLVLDDDAIARNLINSYISKVENLHLVASVSNHTEAMEVLQNNQIHLFFCDIEMPEINGIDFLKTLTNPPLFILITAHTKYASEGFEIDAVDFLTKPFNYTRFLKSVNKAIDRIESKHKAFADPNANFFFVRMDTKLIKFYFDDVLFIESDKDYVKIHTTIGKPQSVWLFLKNMEDQLPKHTFVRTHKSYIVNITKVDIILNDEIMIANHRVPLGMSYKDTVMKAIEDKLIKK